MAGRDSYGVVYCRLRGALSDLKRVTRWLNFDRRILAYPAIPGIALCTLAPVGGPSSRPIEHTLRLKTALGS